MRLWLIVLSLAAFASRVSAEDILPASPVPVSATATATAPGTPEEVVVAAPEPRYVAPTLRDRIGRVWAPVFINGQGPYRLVLDTGANASAVIPSLATRIGAPIDSGPVKLLGATGSSLVSTISVDSIEIGDLLLSGRKMAIVEDVFGGAEGVLGADGLSDKRILIDFSNDHISIRHSSGALPSAGYARVPVKIRNGHLLMFEVRLAGVRTKAMLDTGAQRTVGNTSLREALARRARNGETEEIVGVTLDVHTGEVMSIPPVDIGGVSIRGMRVTFGDIYIFNAWKLTEEPALLIGMDIIGLLDTLIIDYKRREMRLRPRSSGRSSFSRVRQGGQT